MVTQRRQHPCSRGHDVEIVDAHVWDDEPEHIATAICHCCGGQWQVRLRGYLEWYPHNQAATTVCPGRDNDG